MRVSSFSSPSTTVPAQPASALSFSAPPNPPDDPVQGGRAQFLPFSTQAFAQARARHVPVFLVIGTLSEAFDDPALSAQIRERTVPVHLLPGERPDIELLCRCIEHVKDTYGVQVYGTTDYIPAERYEMHINFDTNEEMADELREIVMKELQQIADNGPLTEDIEKTREFLLKNWQNTLEQNGSWMGYLQSKYSSGLDYAREYKSAVEALTNADVQAMARKVLDDGNLVKVIMRPAAAEEK